MNVEELKKHGFNLYLPSIKHDLTLFRWWARLNQEETFETVFLKDSKPLNQFFSIFAPPTIALFTQDDNSDIEFIAWISPFKISSSAVFLSLWSSPSLRGTKRLITLTGLIYDTAFNYYENLFGVTRLQKLKAHSKIGYDVTGNVPGFYPDEDGYQVHLTKDKFKASKLYPVYKELLCRTP
jgi:hypothetical protein